MLTVAGFLFCSTSQRRARSRVAAHWSAWMKGLLVSVLTSVLASVLTVVQAVVLVLLLPALAFAQSYRASSEPYVWVATAGHANVSWDYASCTGGGAPVDDDITPELPLGFTFRYGSVNYTSVRVMSNGRLQFNNTYCYAGTDAAGPPPTYTLPMPDANLARVMRIYGADLDPSVAGSVTYAMRGTAPNRSFVVTWTDVPEYGESTSRFNLQVVLYENGDFVYQFGNINNPSGGRAQIGWQLTTGDYALASFSSIGALTNTALRWSSSSGAIGGTVFEDLNYGGGAGRDRATALAAGGSGRPGVQVELYRVVGSSSNFVATTTTDAAGAYAFTGLPGGTYQVRVVNSTVTSGRTGTVGGLLPVQTFRTDASSFAGSVGAVTDRVGGEAPDLTDAAANGSTTLQALTTGAYTAQSVAPVQVATGAVGGVDFGFNFSTVVNANDSGQGSLRQFVINANALGDKAALAQAGRTAGIESSIFMLPTSAAGYQTGTQHWRISLASGLTLSADATVIDGTTQAGALLGNLWAGTPHTLKVELQGQGGFTALTLNGTDAGAIALAVGGAEYGVRLGGTRNFLRASHLGTNITATAINSNIYAGVAMTGADPEVGGLGAADGNVIGGTTWLGIATVNGSTGVAIRGNFIGSNAFGTATLGSLGWGIGNFNGLVTVREIRRNLIVGAVRGFALESDDTLAPRSGQASWSFAGNHVGVGRDGTTALPNGIGIGASDWDANLGFRTGALVIGGSAPADRNVIAGNTGVGVRLLNTNDAISVVNNLIGTAADGTTARPNGSHGIHVMSNFPVTIGGPGPTDTNTIANNSGKGVVFESGTGAVRITRNRIFANTGGPGIDLGNDGITVNNGVKTTGQPNLLMNSPVFTTASLSGNTLSVAGYVGSAAGQTVFGNATVEVFAGNGSSVNAWAQVYLGTLTADGSGNFSGTIDTTGYGVVNGSTRVTGTATDAMGNTSEFGNNPVVGVSLGGTVFEDTNYGGGAGRNRSTALAGGGAGVVAATVELYTADGFWMASTATAADGSYNFAGLGGSEYLVRVLQSSVRSNRSGSNASVLGVQTFRQEASWVGAAPVTDQVGGTDPAASDAAAAPTLAWTLCAAEGAACSFTGTRVVRYGALNRWTTRVLTGGTGCINEVFGDPSQGTSKNCYFLNTALHSVSSTSLANGSLAGVDFGFNFDTVVSTNDSGPGSLRQVLTNAEALGGDAALAVAGRAAGIEHVLFMVSNGSAAAGLRSANNFFSGGVATIAPASALPVLASPLVIDAQRQPGWTATPVVELNGAAAGAATNGLVLGGASSTVRGLVINRFSQNGIAINGIGLVVEGNVIGLNSAGTAAMPNALNGVLVGGGSATLGGLTASARNVISGNTLNGVFVSGGTANVRGNFIGANAANNAALGNGGSGVLVVSSNATVGGTVAGAANVIRGNAGKGVAIANGAFTGNAVLGNSIYGNASLGIDLKDDGLTAVNDGAKTAGTSNLSMNSPVFTSASLAGTALTVAGYVGSAAGQAVFAAARVEVFVADASSAAGQGQTYLGALTTDASGNFSGSLTGLAGIFNGTTQITATATDSANNTSEFGANVTLGLAVTGTVFEDANYGGGAGRSLAATAGAGVSGAVVEVYDNNGAFVRSTTSGSGGAYSLSGLAAGTYHVRVVSSSVLSQRSGAVAGLFPVLTFRTSATSGSALPVTDFVGGTNPAFADPGAASAGAAFSTTTYAYSSGLLGTAHAVASVTVGSAAVVGVDFGFNFDTVSNTNASGPGSLAQVLTNANTLGGDASLAQGGRAAAIENVVFMIPNGSAGAGLRSAFNYFVGGTATIAPTAALPTVSSALVIDAQTQPGWTANPVLELRGSSAGATAGLVLGGGGVTVRGWVINRYAGAGISVTAGGNNTLQGNWIGLDASGSAAAGNTGVGISLSGGGTGQQIGGTGATLRNVVSGNGSHGIAIDSGAATVLGNTIGLNVAGTAALANANGIVLNTGGHQIGGSSAAARNVVSGNTARGVWLNSANNTVQGNAVGSNAAGTSAVANGTAGIDVMGPNNAVGGAAAGAGNVVSGNGAAGVRLDPVANGSSVQGNSIGLNAAGSTALGNATGIDVGCTTGCAIGGTAAGAGNTVSGNTGQGVVVQVASSGNAVLGNRIFGNGGIAIDLGNDGVTVNDGAKTTGAANLKMDSPLLTSARATGSQLAVAGYVGSAAGQSLFASSRVEIFASDNDASGYGGGKTYLGALVSDASGNFSGTLAMPVSALTIGSRLSSTATDTAGNTSEFGANFSGLIVDLVVNDNGDAADASAGDGLCATAAGGNVCTLRAAIQELNAWGALATRPSIVFALPGCSSAGAAACTIAPASALPSVNRSVLIDGSTQAGFSTVSYSPIVEISGANAPGGTSGLVVAASNSTLRGLVVNRYPANGVTLSGTGNTLVGMRIGLAAGSASAAPNGVGIGITGSGSLIGGATAVDRNVIAGNNGAGITVGAGGNSTTLSGNLIGTDAAGSAGLGNGGSGVAVLAGSPTGVTVSGNVITNNGGAGVGVAGGGPAQVLITVNAMSGNGGLGIDLGNDGVTANTGVVNASLPNQGINMPVINGAGVGSGSTSVTVYGVIGTGAGQGAFAGARVEFFKAAADPTGYGEGLAHLGFLTADANGRFSGSVTYSAGALTAGDAITATATDAAGNTSEFSANRTTTTVAALTPGNFNAFDASTAAAALVGPVTSKVAGAAASFAVIALDNSGTVLHPGFTGTVSLNWIDARDDSGALSGTCRASWVDKGSAGTATFSNNARVTVALTPPASGTRVMRLKITYTGGSSPVTACSNDAYAALPASFSWTGASDADSSTAGTARALDNTAASGGVVHRAGRPFTVRARALDATGALMTGYDGSPVLAAAGCLLPSGCTAAMLTAPGMAMLVGAYTNSSVSYAEVGALQLQLTDASYADVDAADTAIGVRTLTSTLLSVGRFIPDSLAVVVSTSALLGTANAACLASGAGATFIGQGFGWATAPQVTVTALNAAGATTARWTGSLMKLTPGAGLVEVLTAGNTGGATFSGSYGTVGVTDLGAGQARVTASTTDRFLLDRAGGSVQDSTTPTWAWSLAVTDASEAAVAGNPTLVATANQASVAFNSGGVFHSGRLSLSPGYGDVRSGVRLLAQLQRYTAAGWVTMTEDQGCVTIQNQNVGVEAPTGVFATLGACSAPLTGSVTTRGGRAWLALPATPGGAPGRLTLRLAGPAATGSSCTAAGASAALLPLAPNWLLGGASAVGPQALATWGKPQRDALLRRETW